MKMVFSKSNSDDDYLFISVSDNGPGIDPKLHNAILSPFFTLKKLNKGLGLSYVKGIVELHNGAINLISSPDNGTTIEIYLPVGNQTNRDENSPHIDLDFTNQEVLIVEDNKTIQETIEKMMDDFGYHYQIASDGQEALNILDSLDKFGLIILDLTLLKISGIEIYNKLQQKNSKIPILLISGYHDSIQEIFKTYGRNINFLAKPFSIQDLKDTISEIKDKINN